MTSPAFCSKGIVFGGKGERRKKKTPKNNNKRSDPKAHSYYYPNLTT